MYYPLMFDEPTTISAIQPQPWPLSVPDRNIDLVMSDTGELISAAPGSSEWLQRPDILPQLREALDQRGTGWWSLPPLYVRCVELRTATGHHWLLTVMPPREELAMALTELSPTQLVVAEFAAAGATAIEIGRAMDRSPATIRSHLKVTYQRLGVANRVELAQVLRRPAISYGF